MISSTHDPLCADADRFVEKARAAGVRVEHQQEQGLWHVFPLQAGLVARGATRQRSAVRGSSWA